jgi:hypothetical protein
MLRHSHSAHASATRPAPDRGRRRHGFALTAILLFLLLLVYGLAPIPITYAVKHRGFQPPAWIDAVYAPTDWLYDRTPLRKPMERYLDFLDRL